MSSLILSTESSEGYTSVSNIFISEYVPGANGEFVKVYLSSAPYVVTKQ